MTSKIVKTGRVSVIIPCYNQGDTLDATLASVESSRNENLREVIIVNDGSTDPHTLKYFNGLGAARNAGIRASTGEYILPLDSDNLVRSGYLVGGVKLLENHPDIGVVYGNAEYFGEKSGPWYVENFDMSRLVYGNYIDACALIRKTALDEAGGYDEKMPYMGWEDWDLWLRLGALEWGFHHLDEFAFDYRVRNGSMINNTDKHSKELLHYIYHKPGNFQLKLLRDILLGKDRLERELAELKKSKLYRIHKKILSVFNFNFKRPNNSICSEKQCQR
jgi:glycosyltransferase involved in cell wall biosynthesis